MRKILLFIIFVIFGCSGGNNNEKRASQSLVSYQKYDFVNSTFIPNSELIIIIYNNGFSVTKTSCESLFFSSQNIVQLPINSTTIITGTSDSYDQLCFPSQLSLEISNNGNLINNKKIYSIKVLSDLYNTYLDN